MQSGHSEGPGKVQGSPEVWGCSGGGPVGAGRLGATMLRLLFLQGKEGGSGLQSLPARTGRPGWFACPYASSCGVRPSGQWTSFLTGLMGGF